MVASDYIAISAVIIALASLYVAVQQVSLTRSHNRLSVRPMLTVYRKQFSNHPVEYSVANHGLGPAIIKGCGVLVDDRIVNAPEGNVLLSALSLLELNKINVGGNLLGADEVLENGQEVVLLRFIKSHEDPALYSDLIGKLPRIKFKIQYESMYGDKSEYLGNG